MLASSHALEIKMLETEFKYYKDNQEELVKRYKDKFLVIAGNEIAGVYNTQLEAYTEAKKKYEPGRFLIQHCLPGKNSTTQTYHSRVIFS